MDIVDDLRDLNSMHTPNEVSGIADEAADEIERLRSMTKVNLEAFQNNVAEIERLREDLIEAEKYNGYHQQACLEIERLREALRNIADKTVCSYAKITATVALINWQEPTALQQNGSE